MKNIVSSSNKEFFKVLIVIGFPILTQNMISAMVNLIDTVMVGTLGDNAIAAVGASNQVYFILNLIILGVSSGVAIFMAQYWGKKDIEGLKKSVVFGLSILVPFMLIVTVYILLSAETIIRFFTKDENVINIGTDYLKIVCFSYIPAALSIFLSYSLRSIEKIKISVYITIFALALNVLLNYILIFGISIFPELGVRGAAIATLISRAVQALSIIVVIYSKKTAIAIKHIKRYLPEKNLAKNFIDTSGSVFINELLYGFGNALFFSIIGKISKELFAGANIAKQVETLIWIFFWSMCAAASVSIGKLIGESKYKKAQRYANKFLWSGLVLSIILAIILIISIPSIISMFNVSKQTKDIASLYLSIFSFFIIFRGPIKILTGGVMRAGGDTMYVLFWDIIPQFAAVFLCFVSVKIFTVPNIVILIILIGYEIIKVIPSIIRVKSGKWINNLVADRR